MMSRSSLIRLLSKTNLYVKYRKLSTCEIGQLNTKRFVHYSFPNSKRTIFKHIKGNNNFQERKFWLSANHYNEEKDVFAPAFPESVAEGDIRWNKNAGDSVNVDEVVCEIETDKTAIPIPSPGNGVITQVFAEDGSTVKSGQKLFKIKLGPSGAAPSKMPVKKPTPEKRVPSPPQQQAPTQEPRPPQKKVPTQAPKLPPKTPESLKGAYLKLPPEDPTKEISGLRSEYKTKMSRMRQRIAQRLKEAQNTCAMLTTFHEIDMSYIMAFRKVHQDAFTKKFGIKLGFMSAFLRASVYALQDQPVVNAVIVGNEIIYRDYIDISVAVASPKGLLVPVIRNVEKMNYADIEKAINILGLKAKKGDISIEDMDGGTFTVSNGGTFGSLMGTPIINPPQSAILGMHGIFERPVAIDNQVLIRPMMYVALTYDHRLVDGREAVLFLRKIKAGVENPTIILSGL